jgi:hypothetical protein
MQEEDSRKRPRRQGEVHTCSQVLGSKAAKVIFTNQTRHAWNNQREIQAVRAPHLGQHRQTN